MNSIIRHMPDRLKTWGASLSDSDVAGILTMVGDTAGYTKLTSPKGMSSASIGMSGEATVEGWLSKKYTIANTAKSSNRGDFIVEVGGCRILVEVKKYSKTVPSSEIEKFYKDIDSNGSIDGGVFISLTSKIVGISGCMDYSHRSIRGDNIPVIFLALENMGDSIIAEQSVYAAIDIIRTEKISKSSYIDISENISCAIHSIGNNMDFLSQCRLILHETQDMFNKQMGKAIQQVLSAEINIKHSIDVLKSKVEIYPSRSICTDDQFAEYGLSTTQHNLLKTCVSMVGDCTMAKNIITVKGKHITIKILKTKIKISIDHTISETLSICGEWSYDGKAVTITLTESTLGVVTELIEKNIKMHM